MEAALARLVRQRARNRCEYCRMLQEYDDASFEIDLGRVTVDVLNINHPLRVELRQELMEEGVFVP